MKGRLEKARREADELAVWGDFSPEAVKKLAEDGVVLRFFSVYDSEFAAVRRAAGDAIIVEPVAEREGRTYFVVVAPDGGEIPFDAQEQKAPETTAAGKRREIAAMEAQMDELRAVMARAYASRDAIEAHGERLRERLDFSRAAAAAAAKWRTGSLSWRAGPRRRLRRGWTSCWRNIRMSSISRRSLRRRTILPSF